MGTEEEVNVDFMFKKSTTLYVNSESLQCSAVELPYAGGELSFVAILPHAVDGLPALEQRLDVTSLLEQLLADMKPETDLLVYLPKFKIETSVELSSHLKKLGIVDLFDRETADLRGIESKGVLYVSAIAHKACIEVNEDGCEAAAATAGMVRAAGGRAKQYTSFDANHPFMFLIKENATNSVLFTGEFCRPEGSC